MLRLRRANAQARPIIGNSKITALNANGGPEQLFIAADEQAVQQQH